MSFVAYLGLFGLATATWIGVPGTGESALIAAGAWAGRHDEALVPILIVATCGAALGGQIGYWLGRGAGRTLLEVQGPFVRTRRRALRRGERLFAHHGRLGALLAPTWVSGAMRLPSRTFVPWNCVAATMWACLVGIGAFLLGPRVQRILDAIGTPATIVIATAALVVLAAVVRRGLSRSGRGTGAAARPANPPREAPAYTRPDPPE